MTEQDHAVAAVVYRWFEEVWNQGRTEVIDEMMDIDCTLYGINDGEGNPLQGPDGFKPFYKKFRDSFPDIHITIEDLLVKGDKVAARCHVRGTHAGDGLGIAATQKPIEFTGMCIARIKNGKVMEAWNNFDFMGMYQQVGLLPTI
jgi:steroid delta-isomerase-like uncharacterized protein